MNRKTLIAAILGLALLAAVPLMTSNSYYTHMIGTIMIYAILLYGLDIVVGYTGQVSLGHAGLFGVGSYTAGVLFMKLGAPLWVIIPASIGVTAAFGAVLALLEASADIIATTKLGEDAAAGLTLVLGMLGDAVKSVQAVSN